MEYVEYEVRDRIALVTLNRPEARNAQIPDMLREIDAAYEHASEDDAVRVIVLKANGKHFSAGHDISPQAAQEHFSREAACEERALRAL